MEEDIQHSASALPVSKLMMSIQDRLEEAIKIASDRQNYEAAHNPQILLALDTVRNFLVRRGRVCYGGTAMNMILPPAKRFYNPEVDLPDYDFFTPSIETDVEELVDSLKAAGFKDVHHKVGIHEGTKKIMVNFVPVADISALDPHIYNTFHKNAIKKNGVYYTDPDTLRMMMYLELSRPKGQVDRWTKVFERLELINTLFPVKATRGCKKGTRGGKRGVARVTGEERSFLLDYIIEKQRILCSGPLDALYAKGIERGKAAYDLRGGEKTGPILFLTPSPRQDCKELRTILSGTAGGDYKLFLHKAHGEIVPERVEIRRRGQPIALAIQEVACHAYNHVPTSDGRDIFVASLEILMTLYISLAKFTNLSPKLFDEDVMCKVRRFLELSLKNYSATGSQFPAFALSCRGYQKGFATLLREKVYRIQRERNGLTDIARASTRKLKKESSK
jgi:hypothetical protein